MSGLQEAEGGMWEGRKSQPQMCLCAEASQEERCAGAWPGTMVLPQDTAGLRTVLVPCFSMQGSESHCTFCCTAAPLLTQVCPWAVRGSAALLSDGRLPARVGAIHQLWHCSRAKKTMELPLRESKD